MVVARFGKAGVGWRYGRRMAMVGSVIGDTSDTDLRVCETRPAPPQVVVAPRSQRSGHDTMAADLPALLFQIQS